MIQILESLFGSKDRIARILQAMLTIMEEGGYFSREYGISPLD